MPSELRIIRFSLKEVEMALRKLAPRIGLTVPEGEFLSATADDCAEKPATIFAMTGKADGMTVPNGLLAASLIYHCRSGDIVLPKDGTKEIYAAPEFVELRIMLRHQLPGEDEARLQRVLV